MKKEYSEAQIICALITSPTDEELLKKRLGREDVAELKEQILELIAEDLGLEGYGIKPSAQVRRVYHEFTRSDAESIKHYDGLKQTMQHFMGLVRNTIKEKYGINEADTFIRQVGWKVD